MEKTEMFWFPRFLQNLYAQMPRIIAKNLIVVFLFQSHSRPSRGNPSSQAPDSPANQPSQTFNALFVLRSDNNSVF
jgi:hypothetical protein